MIDTNPRLPRKARCANCGKPIGRDKRAGAIFFCESCQGAEEIDFQTRIQKIYDLDLGIFNRLIGEDAT